MTLGQKLGMLDFPFASFKTYEHLGDCSRRCANILDFAKLNWSGTWHDRAVYRSRSTDALRATMQTARHYIPPR
jgi:hypothetical protein